jgi:hypothetical protein
MSRSLDNDAILEEFATVMASAASTTVESEMERCAVDVAKDRRYPEWTFGFKRDALTATRHVVQMDLFGTLEHFSRNHIRPAVADLMAQM